MPVTRGRSWWPLGLSSAGDRSAARPRVLVAECLDRREFGAQPVRGLPRVPQGVAGHDGDGGCWPRLARTRRTPRRCIPPSVMRPGRRTWLRSRSRGGPTPPPKRWPEAGQGLDDGQSLVDVRPPGRARPGGDCQDRGSPGCAPPRHEVHRLSRGDVWARLRAGSLPEAGPRPTTGSAAVRADRRVRPGEGSFVAEASVPRWRMLLAQVTVSRLSVRTTVNPGVRRS